MDQKPSVGRVVIFQPSGNTQKPSGYPAVITQVWSDTCVNLSVQNDGSYPLQDGQLRPTSVSQLPADAPAGTSGWSWPPRV